MRPSSRVAAYSKLFYSAVWRAVRLKEYAKHLPLAMVSPLIMALLWKINFEPFDPIPTEEFMEAHMDLIFRGVFIDNPDRDQDGTSGS